MYWAQFLLVRTENSVVRGHTPTVATEISACPRQYIQIVRKNGCKNPNKKTQTATLLLRFVCIDKIIKSSLYIERPRLLYGHRPYRLLVAYRFVCFVRWCIHY